LQQANTNRAGGAASLALLLAVNAAAAGTGPTVTTYLSTSGDSEDYQANLICEVSNVSASPLVGSSANVQNALAAGTNNVTSGNITVSAGQVPCLMVAMSMNTSATAINQNPLAGSGMTSISSSLWAFHNVGANITSTLATQLITTAGTYAATFNNQVTGDIATVAVILQGQQAGIPIAWVF
jgi:hypothetical protein